MSHKKKLLHSLYLFPIFLATLTRLIPIWRWHDVIPLGADAAIYHKNFERCYLLLQQGIGCPDGAVSAISNFLYFFGWQTNHILYLFYLLISITSGALIYLVAKDIFGRKAAFFSLLLFSFSFIQFLAYLAFFWKMMVAINLLLLSFYLFNRRSWLAMAPAAAVGIFHPPTFLALGISMIIYLALGKDKKYTLLTGIATLLMALIFNGSQLIDLLPYYNWENFGQISHYTPETEKFLEGQFINPATYFILTIPYLVFILWGIYLEIKTRRISYPLIFLGVNLAIISLGLVFHNRFTILLDISAIIVAGPALSLFLDRRTIISFLIIILGSAGILYQSWLAEPYITDPTELNAIRKISTITEKNAAIIANNYLYRPFLQGFSNRDVIYGDGEYTSYTQIPIDRYIDRVKLYLYIGSREEFFLDPLKFKNLKRVGDNLYKLSNIRRYE